MNPLALPLRRPWLALVLITVLGGCAALKPSGGNGAAAAGAVPVAAAAAGPSASGVPPGTPQPASPPPGSPKAFALVIKDATKTEGLFTLYQKDEKVWIELAPQDFDKPFFLSPKLATGIGEARLYGGQMDTARVIEFRRIHNQVQMIAVNTGYTALAGTPEGRAVAAAFSPSLLASTPVASQPQPERKSVLVDANALFLNDMLGIGMRLQRTFRQTYAFDARNSAITTLRDRPSGVTLQVLAHFATGSIAVAQPGMAPGAPVPSVPFTVPDPRSLFFTVDYVVQALPDRPMQARAADARIGYFTSEHWDFNDDLARSPIVRDVNRWRLEKKDPAAALSEPVKPIVYWLDRTIPLKYRGAITAGILEWNKAFERIGFKDAIQVRVQPADADFDTLDGGASVRWMTNAAPAFGAIGPSHVDPRSGEILGANIAIESLSSRSIRATRVQILNQGAADYARLMQLGGAASGEPFDPHQCLDAEQGAEQLSYAFDVLAARGELDPNGPQAQQFVLDYLKDTTMHEVGHTLGLRHNFRASRIYTDAQISDPEFTRTHGLTGSVMEYAPINLARPGGALVEPFQTTLGPYDYWAIEYAYKPIAPAHEKAELERIAARSGEPALAFGTDEDNYLGIDPDALQFDLGNDEVAFAAKRLAIARDLFKRQETRELPPDRDYSVLRRSLNYAINDTARAVGVLMRQIGGVRTLRDFPGSGRDPLQPVAAEVQRAALDRLSRGLLAADSFEVPPALQRRLAPDFQERADALDHGASVATEFSVTVRVLALQRTLLAQLMSDPVAARILDSQDKTRRPGTAFQLSELYGRLQRDVWSELDGLIAGRASDIPAPRRALQREYLNRVTALLLRPGAAGRADARSLVRAQAEALLVRVRAASNRRGLDADTRAHLQDGADTLAQALSAKVTRVGL
ncbi:MAG: zinc-dependent metalloprotease [Burkholderiales bacterium]|nr:zinc-dependent metalloprotease [Burkholderiales bacterium]